MKFKKPISKQGFTVVELIVALSVFTIAATMVFGIFARAIRTQRHINYFMTINSDASLVLEKMSREIRSGFNFELTNLGSGCPSASDFYDTLSFARPRGNATSSVVYRWNNASDSIERKEGVGSSFEPLNSSFVLVDRLCFLNTQGTSDNPWRITIVLRASSVNEQFKYALDLETTISPRILPSEA